MLFQLDGMTKLDFFLVNADAGCYRCSELARGDYRGYSPELISLEWFQSIVGSDAGS